MTDDDLYFADVERWIAGALKDRPTDFAALVRQMPGVDPILIHQVLSSSPTLSTDVSRTLVHDAQRHPPRPTAPHPTPVPHPLDFDWRYGDSAVQALTQLVSGLVSDDGCIALIGAPTLIRPLLAQSPSYNIHLIDRNPLWQPAFRDVNLHTIDVAIDPCPPILVGRAEFVVIDPPWYTNSYANFMWFGRQLLKLSGMLAVSVLQVGTRPTAKEDRKALMLAAKQHGFQLVDKHAAVLGYATPPFEKNALGAAGINAPLDEWRYADLWLFSADRDPSVERPMGTDISEWHEVRFDEVRILFDSRANSGSLALESVIPGDILPSISARHPARERATVWTSGNRIFACKNSVDLYRLCRDTPWHSQRGFACGEVKGQESSALSQLVRIIDQELLEYGNRK